MLQPCSASRWARSDRGLHRGRQMLLERFHRRQDAAVAHAKGLDMKRAENGPLDPELRDALRALNQEQRALAAPAEVEDRVMRAWDGAHSATSRGFGRGLGNGCRRVTGRGAWLLVDERCA